MENLTQSLLENYYGFGEDNEDKKSLASYEGFQRELCEQKSIPVDHNGNVNNEDNSGIGPIFETQVDDLTENNGNIKNFSRFSRGFTDDDEAIGDSPDLEQEEVIFDGKNSRKELQENVKIGIFKLRASADGKDEINERGIDDNIPDNASDISSLSTKKKIKKKSRFSAIGLNDPPQEMILMAPMPKKNPIYNKEFCDFTNASIIEFPVNLIEEISTIRMLYLENNCLNELPDQLFTSLNFLQWLDVRNNWLRTLPTTIKNHQALETILLQGNRIEKLPLELCFVPKLKNLQLSGNPLNFPSNEIISKGFNSIMNFLRKEWNEENPNNPISPPQKLKSNSTILCDNPPVINTSRLLKNSTSNFSKSLKTISSREKSRNYKPSNRCSSSGVNSMLEEKLRWISKVRDMLIKQAAELQKTKNQEALKEWRQDRRSFDKSMKKAAERSKNEIPFDVNFDDNFTSTIKNLRKPMSTAEKKNMKTTGDMDKRIFEITESLKNYNLQNESQHLGSDLQLKLLEHEIKKIENLYDQIQALKRQNDISYKKYNGPDVFKSSKFYKPPPSIII